jgi:hypothetical protein
MFLSKDDKRLHIRKRTITQNNRDITVTVEITLYQYFPINAYYSRTATAAPLS